MTPLEKALKSYNNARSFMNVVALLTVLSAILIATIDIYFVSTFIPIYLFFTQNSAVLPIIVSVVMAAVYIFSAFMSKRNPMMFIIGIILVLVDTAFLLYFTFELDAFAEMFRDLIYHVFTIGYFFVGLFAGIKAKRLRGEEEAMGVYENQIQPEIPGELVNEEIAENNP